jgi:hypothetical protein
MNDLVSRRPRVGITWACVLTAGILATTFAKGSVIWVEGEKPIRSTMHRHPWWYDQVKRDQFSGADFISNFDEKQPGEAWYRFEAAKAGDYEFWVRANPVLARLFYRINSDPWTEITLDKEQQGNANVASDGKVDLRFLAWVKVGKMPLTSGTNYIRFRMEGKNSNHGFLDCFVFADEPFKPNGAFRPGQLAAVNRQANADTPGWFAFNPKADEFSAKSGIDLRGLNEKVAGDGGFIGVKGSQFVHSKTGLPVKFWAVNGPPGKDADSLRHEARVLAKYGVNLVRFHHYYGDPTTGEIKPDEIKLAHAVVGAMKAEGIYTHFSIYFPVWMTPGPWLAGYDGKTHPFASIYFNKDFQEKYRAWWRALLLTPSPTTGKRLIDDPAVAGVELVNEDSYFFWTFDRKSIPDPQLKILEHDFGDWLKAKYGSLDAVAGRWGALADARDKPSEGRIAFRPLWNIANERLARDKDAARFLTEAMKRFYDDHGKFLRELGYKGVITASNWTTADPRVLGPLERYAYTGTDFIDRHGYFAPKIEGQDVAWSIRDGHVYADRSALRFDNAEPGNKPKVFANPVTDITYDNKPSMISEASWNRPNRYRTEAPLFFAAYGALQGSDSIVQFAFDGGTWSVKPGYFMQPWTLMSPGLMGQFPAAALLFRKGLVSEGDLLVDLNLSLENLYDLQGTPLPQDANLDELRLKDVPEGTTLKPGNVIDPLVHFAGRTNVSFSEKGAPPKLKDLRSHIDHAGKTVFSTNRQLRLDYGRGVLTIDAPAAQGVSGMLSEVGAVELTDLVVTSHMELGHIIAVSLDDQPIAKSRKILLQVMSEEKPFAMQTTALPGGMKQIVSIGRDPWMVKQFEGSIRLKRPDAAKLKVTALDENGEPLRSIEGAETVKLGSTILYYLIESSR